MIKVKKIILAVSLCAFSSLNASSEDIPPMLAVTKEAVFDQKRPLEQEFKMSVPNGFTVVAVGDCISSRPLYQKTQTDQNLGKVAKILQGASVTFGNLETSILDLRTCRDATPQGCSDWPLRAESGVADDFRMFGFKMFSRANNHALDWGVAGMRETTKNLEAVHLVHAGSGENSGEAYAPRYFDSESRIGLVSTATSFNELSQAMPPSRGGAPGRPGISTIKVTQNIVVKPEMFKQLSLIKYDLDVLDNGPGQKACAEEDREMEFLDRTFIVGDSMGYDYQMDEKDLKDFLISVRAGKPYSDFLIATVHSHESYGNRDKLANFLPVLAHKAIDSGADVFLVHGSHVLGPIEIYKNRVVAYGLGNFFWSDIQGPLSQELYDINDSIIKKTFVNPQEVTDAELSLTLNANGFADERMFQSIIILSKYDNGHLVEVKLYPIDLGYGNKLSQSGIPHLASPEIGKKILTRIQVLSEQFGTRINIQEDGTGAIILAH